MKTQPEINPALHQESHEMLIRLLKVAELLNKGTHDQQQRDGLGDQKLAVPVFAEKERQKP